MGRTTALVTLLVLLGAFRLLFPGDVPFVNDEARLLEQALDANAASTLASAGLLGTRGARYGPVPIWFYQAALSLTSDPTRIAAARILFVTTLTALALTLLSRSLSGLDPVLGAFAFLSPYLWFYARDLWDNSFSIPFSAMLLAGYARFMRDGGLRFLALAAVSGTLCLMTHLMTLPLVGTVGLHFAATRWRGVLESRRLALGIVGIATVCVGISLPYLGELSVGSATAFRLLPSLGSVAFALNGARLFSLAGFDYFIGRWRLVGLEPVAVFVSSFSYVAAAYGLFLCVKRMRADDSLERQEGTVLVLALALFVLMANGLGLGGHPHYYSGVWIVFFCFWWIGASGLMRAAWARRVFLGQVSVMTLYLLGVATWIHSNRGTKTLHYGPTLENQMAVASDLDRLGIEGMPPSTALAPRLFPHAIGVLRRLDRRGVGGMAAPTRASMDFRIVYADPEGGSGEIVLQKAAARPAP